MYSSRWEWAGGDSSPQRLSRHWTRGDGKTFGLRSWGCFRNSLSPKMILLIQVHLCLTASLGNLSSSGTTIGLVSFTTKHKVVSKTITLKVHLFRLVAEVVLESATHLTTSSPLHWPCPGTPSGTRKGLPRRKASLCHGTILPFNHLCQVVSRATSRWTPPCWWVCLPLSCTRWRWWWCRSEDHVSMFHFKLSNIFSIRNSQWCRWAGASMLGRGRRVSS